MLQRTLVRLPVKFKNISFCFYGIESLITRCPNYVVPDSDIAKKKYPSSNASNRKIGKNLETICFYIPAKRRRSFLNLTIFFFFELKIKVGTM